MLEKIQRDTFEFQNLGEVLDTPLTKPEELIQQLLYKEGIHTIYSPGGTGKTILAVATCLQVARNGGTVIYVDEENGKDHILFLLQCLGADVEEDLIFHYAESPGYTTKDANKWQHTIEAILPDLVVFDSFADLLAVDGLGENTSTDVTSWIKRFAQPVKDNGGAALILDHVAKDETVTGARGSTAKRNKVDVAWKLKRDSEFDMTTIGRVTLTRDKDRKGTMPHSLEYEIGGDGDGNLICQRTDVQEHAARRSLNDSEWKAYTALKRFDTGAKSKEWENASGLTSRTFHRVKKALLAERYAYCYEDTATFYPITDDETLFNEIPI